MFRTFVLGSKNQARFIILILLTLIFNELESRFLLNACGCLGPAQQNLVLQEFGCAEEFINSPELFNEVFEEGALAHFRSNLARLSDLELFKSLSKQGVRFMLKEDEDFPTRLLQAPDPPHLLYLKGEVPQSDQPCVAVVGTRTPSSYGRRQAQRFGQELAESGLWVISGVARGIDAAVMESALCHGGQALGFLGTGIDIVYPRQNEDLFKKLSQQGGLMSEFAPGSPARAHHFPFRNRLIAAMGLGVLVLECRVHSGTMTTVRWALDAGKEIFALPGPADLENCRGNHQLLRDGAVLTEGVLDIFRYGRISG